MKKRKKLKAIPKVYLEAKDSKTVAFLVNNFTSISAWCRKYNVSQSNLYAALLQTRPTLRVYKPHIKTRAYIVECLLTSGARQEMIADGWSLNGLKEKSGAQK